MTEGVNVADTTGVIVFTNPAFDTMFGYTKGELIGKHISVLNDYAPNENHRIVEEIISHLNDKGFWAGEIHNRKKNGTPFTCQARVSALEMSSKIFWISVQEDITERKQVEAERRKLDEQLQQTQKLESLGIMAGGVAHDFNKLLCGIMGNTSLAIKLIPPENQLHPILQHIDKASQRAAELTNQLLAYSGGGIFELKALNISHMVQEMTTLLQTIVTKKGILECRFAEDLPLIRANLTQIRQVVMNLIMNASEALGSGEGTITLKTGVVDADVAYLLDT